MKRQELTQIKGLGTKELRLKATSIKGEIVSLVMDKNRNKLKDLKIISKKRKDLAQVLTVMRQKQLLAELESQPKAGQSVAEKEVKI